jgi:hypothetical protein
MSKVPPAATLGLSAVVQPAVEGLGESEGLGFPREMDTECNAGTSSRMLEEHRLNPLVVEPALQLVLCGVVIKAKMAHFNNMRHRPLHLP